MDLYQSQSVRVTFSLRTFRLQLYTNLEIYFGVKTKTSLQQFSNWHCIDQVRVLQGLSILRSILVMKYNKKLKFKLF